MKYQFCLFWSDQVLLSYLILYLRVLFTRIGKWTNNLNPSFIAHQMHWFCTRKDLLWNDNLLFILFKLWFCWTFSLYVYCDCPGCFHRGIGNKKLGKVKNFQVWVAFSKGQKQCMRAYSIHVRSNVHNLLPNSTL